MKRQTINFSKHKFTTNNCGNVNIYSLKGEKSVFVISGHGITAVSGDYANWLFNESLDMKKHFPFNEDHWVNTLDHNRQDSESYRPMLFPIFDAFMEIKVRVGKNKLTVNNFSLFNEVKDKFSGKTYNEKKWLECYDKLIRIDGYSEKAILYIVSYFRKDGSWWKETGNFESLLKLRRTDNDGIKYIDVFAQKIKGQVKLGSKTFAVGNKITKHDGKQRDY